MVLHGGPGSGCSSGFRRLFDPSAYRIVLFDQRGCGRSRPLVDAAADLATNTTDHLVEDLERLRTHLGISRRVVYGLSWGVTLGLAYAERHPESVVAMVASSVTLTRPRDIHWLYHEVGRYYPEAWDRFRQGALDVDRDGDLVDGYYGLLHVHNDPTVRERAAADWCRWEDTASPLPDGRPNRRYEDPAFRMTFARIVTHYFHHQAWLSEDELLRNAARLGGIPAVLVHGRFDLGGPVDSAWQLARAWPAAQLVVVDTAHAGGDPVTAAVIDATDHFTTLS